MWILKQFPCFWSHVDFSNVPANHSGSHKVLVSHWSCEIAQLLKGRKKKNILHPWNWCCQSSLYCPSLVLKPHRPGKADRSAILRWIYYEIAWCNWSKKIRGKKCCNERALFHGPHIIATGQEGDGRSVKVKYGWRTFPVKIMFHFQKEVTVKYICL